VADAARPVYSIGAVAQMLSIAPATLRSWEDRYGLVVPERSAGGHRLYSRDQIDQLQFIQAQLAEGAHTSDAHRLLAERLDAQGSVPGTAAGVQPAEPSPPVGHPVILIAENDPYAAELDEFFLRTEGYEALRVLSADDAVAQFRLRSPILVVIELMISGGMGAELCRSFKRDRAVPVVMVSSLAARGDAAAAGADAFLSKPFDPLVLVSTVKDLLGSSSFLHADSPATREI
jgi:DNA-binding transcriptional MerR regulator